MSLLIIIIINFDAMTSAQVVSREPWRHPYLYSTHKLEQQMMHNTQIIWELIDEPKFY